MTKLRDERMDDARRARRARWSLCNILAAVVPLPEINAPSMPSFSTVALAAGASVIVLAIATRTSPLQALDDGIERAAGRLRQRAGVLRAASIGTLPGEPYMHPTIGAACAAIVIAATRGPFLAVLAALAVASVGAILAHHAVKLVYRRPRPAGALARGKTEPAFPSGHTTDATAVLVTAAYLLVRQGLVTPGVVTVLALLLALSTGVSRVLLGWHWATDVVGGWIAGVGVAACASGLYESLTRVS
jgi:undecaprenyl-diphosphatase